MSLSQRSRNKKGLFSSLKGLDNLTKRDRDKRPSAGQVWYLDILHTQDTLNAHTENTHIPTRKLMQNVEMGPWCAFVPHKHDFIF